MEEFQQEIMVDSTTEAEYITAFEAAKEVVWIRKFIGELGVVSSIVDPITIIVTTMEHRASEGTTVSSKNQICIVASPSDNGDYQSK